MIVFLTEACGITFRWCHGRCCKVKQTIIINPQIYSISYEETLEPLFKSPYHNHYLC